MPNFTIDTTLDINAAPDAVWDVLTDFASYKEWNPAMRIEGAPEVGTKLHAHLTGMSLNPKCSPPPPAKNCDGSASSGTAGSPPESTTSSSPQTTTEPPASTTANATPAH